ncbi:hypothetical protein LTS08_002907 [Lithohypha guttulata]|nr:hypothetical protein LTS08_002907 [Lithohypha guttulata]
MSKIQIVASLALATVISLLCQRAVISPVATPDRVSTARAEAQEQSSNLSTNTFVLRASPEVEAFDYNSYVEFFQFENAGDQEDNYKNAFLTALIEVQAMVTIAYEGVREQLFTPTSTDSLVERYFRSDPAEWQLVLDMYERLAQALGAPQYNDLRKMPGCVPTTPKLHVYYLDPPPYPDGTPPYPNCQSQGDLLISAYVFKNHGWDIQDKIVLCPEFFSKHRTFEEVDENRDLIYDYIEFGYTDSRKELTYTSSRILLHGHGLELMHYSPLYSDFFNSGLDDGRIVDLQLYDSNSGTFFGAYGAWAATCITYNLAMYYPQWGPLDPDVPLQAIGLEHLANPKTNVDNWVYNALEYFYRRRYSIAEEWLQPPMRAGGPHFPEGHPGLSDPRVQPPTPPGSPLVNVQD